MSIALLLTVGGLTSVGLYLITARSLSRIILGFSLLGHASVLALLVSGGPPGRAPLADTAEPSELANPLPQALALTAIVISFGLTLFLLALAGRQQTHTGDDLVEDDLEDKRVAGLIDAEPDADDAEANAAAADDSTADQTAGSGVDTGEAVNR